MNDQCRGPGGHSMPGSAEVIAKRGVVPDAQGALRAVHLHPHVVAGAVVAGGA